MNTGPKLSRRQVVALLCGLGGIGLGGIATNVLVASRSSGLLPDFRIEPDALRYIADKYFLSYPAERNAEYLKSLLLAGIQARATGEQLTEAIVAAIRRDFEKPDTILLDSWLLSRTEARLWALCDLM